MNYDAFISHASEDKDVVARPLAEHLKAMGYRVWYDEFTLRIGDSLRQSIDKGLATSRYGVVILSKAFFSKNWPPYELDGLLARELDSGEKVILPVWHGITKTEVGAHSWPLADRVAAVTTLPLEDIANKLAEVLGTPPLASKPLPMSFAPPDEEICPRCKQKGVVLGYEGTEGDSFSWFECRHCGLFQPLGG